MELDGLLLHFLVKNEFLLLILVCLDLELVGHLAVLEVEVEHFVLVVVHLLLLFLHLFRQFLISLIDFQHLLFSI